MKRFTIILVAALCFATTIVNAQIYDREELLGIYLYYTPGLFTISGNPYLTTHQYYDDFGQYYYMFDANFELVDSFQVELGHENFYYENYSLLQYTDLDNLISERFQFTQNLFNDDEYFEYITYGAEEAYPYTCFSIKSSNGSILQTIHTDEGYELSEYTIYDIIKFGNHYYLMFNECDNEGCKCIIYQIDQYQGLTKVETELPISVFPSIANRDQQITVELGEGNNAKEVTVVNGLGQVIKRVPVQEGQRQVTIPTQELNSGLNVVNTRTQQGQGSCKIIVH